MGNVNKEFVEYDLGKSFPPATVYAGQFLTLMGIVVMITQRNVLATIPIICIGLLMAFTRSKCRIEPSSKKFKKFNSLFGLENGQSLPLEKFSAISILRNTYASTAYSWANTASETGRDTFYELFLLNHDHSIKELVARFPSFEAAQMEIKNLSKLLDFDEVKYRPPGSRR